MDKGSNRRDLKIITGGHSTRIEGMNKLLAHLVTWQEITYIRLGRITHRRSGSGGGFTFRATRLAVNGPHVTGINCHAINGTFVQYVILVSNDLDALKSRLHAEGYGAEW